MTAAWIGFAGGIVAAVISALVAVRQSRSDERLAQVKVELDAETHRRAALFDRDLAAEDVLAKYRDPLAAAAFDLQSRLYNILRMSFFEKYSDTERREDAVTTTIFRIAQYFGWVEILRRDIQFLSFPEEEATRRVTALQKEIAWQFLTDSHGHDMMIWTDEQRAMGERMIVEEYGKVIAMGYAAFREQCDSSFAPWSTRLRREIGSQAAEPRLREVQHLLCDLVRELDRRGLRYTQGLDRA